MGIATLTCDRCRNRIPAQALNTPGTVLCPGCDTPIRFLIFPAYYRAHAPGQSGETIMVEGESSCFYHPSKKAVVPCEGCGRFLCALCDVELDNRHLCPKCLEAAKEKKTIGALERERYRYDLLAFNLGLAGLFLAWCAAPFALCTAAASLFLAIRHWNKPTSLMSDSKKLLVWAIVLSSLQIAVALLALTVFGLALTST